ncbi:MAG: hypothetical protein ACR2PL_06010, partial [Dehalococcoidia bacterium]
MAQPMNSSTRRPRVSINVDPEFRRRLRLAAAKRDVSVREYLLEVIEDRLRQDVGDEFEGPAAMTAMTDPLLAEVWDNPRDAEYDRLEP